MKPSFWKLFRKYLKAAAGIYVALGLITACFYLLAAGWNVDLNPRNVLLFITIIFAWPLYAWFAFVMWMAYQGAPKNHPLDDDPDDDEDEP